MTRNSAERHWSHVQSCFWVASVHGIWAQNCISYGLFLQSYFWIFWMYKSFGTQLFYCMIHGYGCLASNTWQQFLPCGCLVIQLFWYGMQLLPFIWNLPPPISVTEQMSQFLMVLASSFLWWVGGCERRWPWELTEEAGCCAAKLPWEWEKTGDISQNEYSGSIRYRQGQKKGRSCSVGGSVVWFQEA